LLRKIRHIGIVVDDLKRAVEKFNQGMGLDFTEIIEKKDTGVEVAFAPVGETLIELLHYTKPTQAKRSIVREQKGAINHICFEVDDLEEAIRYFEERRLKVAKGYPASGAHGRIAFFEPSTTEGVLIEICQV
jgi:methylmalonyl-CoA/ethylmalonyl-CoA epimerase